MRFSIRSIDREFSPAEAAEITGVSTALQRDWRRRGILPENADGKWTRWDLNDIIKLSVMKLFSDAGIDVSKTSIVSQMAMMPTRAAISLTEGAITFEGAELPDEEKARVRMTMGPRTSHPSHTVGRYLASTGDGELDFCRADTFAALESLMDKRRPVLSIIDCHSLARLIVERAGPVIRYEVEAKEV